LSAAIGKLIQSGLVGFTPNTIVHAAALRRELARIRAQGYAFDRGDHHITVRCVAAPIRNIAAISVSGPAERGLAPARLCAGRRRRR
jgi:IclR family acetate operon transcriptional repressor